MTVIVPHHKTAAEAIQLVDRSANELFEGAGGGGVQLTDQKRSWNGRVMDFSLSARVGFISLPLAGTVAVDDTNVTIQCELPALVNKFLGEDKIRAGVERKVRGLLGS